jgi:hypothetical protein
MTEFQKLILLLDEFEIEYILIGGLAASVHGSARFTSDIDILYKRNKENIVKIVSALKNIKPYLRGAPKGLPFLLDEKTLEAGLNFTLTTELGYLDLFAEIPGGKYDEVIQETFLVDVFEKKIICVNLKELIRLKKASGRPKDFEAIAELELILENKDERV